MSDFCAEFLVHGVDVEGKMMGLEEELVRMLGQDCPVPVTCTPPIPNPQPPNPKPKTPNPNPQPPTFRLSSLRPVSAQTLPSSKSLLSYPLLPIPGC
jgi:hypothetical protein